MDEESPQLRQSNELQALQAIFDKEFVNCNAESAEWKPLNVILTVLPLRERSGPLEAHVQVNLHVIASEEYPEVAPQIQLEKPKGLSDKHILDIQHEVEQLATSKVGEVMVYDLCGHIQKILTECNKPLYESCYDEMLSKQKEKEIAEAKKLKSDKDIERRLLQLEIAGIKEKRKKVRVDNQETLSTVSTLPMRRRRTISNSSVDDYKTKSIMKLGKSNSEKLNVTWKSDSRLGQDFEIVKFIGKGAFGDVLQVRYKLDLSVYAIKRIKLNSKNKQTNKKIMREVKLLRSLNHENIVRYYFAWLEDVNAIRKYSKENSDGSKTGEHEGTSASNLDEYNHLVDNNRKLLMQNTNLLHSPLLGEGDLNLSFSRPDDNPDFSDYDEEEDEDDDFIEFRREDCFEVDDVDIDTRSLEVYDKVEFKLPDQYLYIMMEYCEEGTLRDAIDANLYKDEIRVWRLLREIVEGLSYIHQQGIIHRDLKPGNIFIDSEDHVKIGDFGLATLDKSNTARLLLNLTETDGMARSEAEFGSHTGQVGTALYVAPEMTFALKVHYNQKVDIYSLGLIFFEMCYKPISTQMERYKILKDLRSNVRKFPEDFFSKENSSKKIKLIRELLNHNHSERPSAAEILQKDYLPPVEVEDKKLHETFRHTLRNPQSKLYKLLISECFNQKVPTAEDITFDDFSLMGKTAWQYAFVDMISDKARKIFRLHGGTFFNMPFLSPHNGVGTTDSGVVSLMTRSGSLVNIPYDNRLAFARYLALNSTVTHMKRYSIDKVFRERRMLNNQPKELFECTYDIVSSNSTNLTMEAEILSVICEILNSLSETLPRNCVIRLNHVALVEAILYQNRIDTKKHNSLCEFLNKTKFQIKSDVQYSKLNHLKLQYSTIECLKNMMHVEISPKKMNTHFECLLKKSSAYTTKYKKAVQDLDILLKHLSYLQIKCPVVIAPDVITNFHYYSGIMFQVVWNKKAQNRPEKHIIAAGGRYDNLIKEFRESFKKSNESEQSAVGVTIYIDKLINVFQMGCQMFSTIDVLVCSMNHNDMDNEKLKLMKELWSAEIRSTILEIGQNLEEIEDYCEKMSVPYILYMKESEPGIVRLKSWVKDKFHEKKLSISEIVPYLKRVISQTNHAEPLVTSNSHCCRSESRSTSVSHRELPQLNISFFVDEKINSNNKRRYENQVFNAIEGSLKRISSSSKVEILVLDAEKEFIRALASTIDFNVKDNSDISSLGKRFPRYKKSLSRITDYVEELQSLDIIPALIFYTLRDNIFKILI